MNSYQEFEKALEILGIVTRFSLSDLKNRYQKLSKEYHPDMQSGDIEKFREVNEAYKSLQNYLSDYRYGVNEEDFYHQKPFLRKSNDWFYDF